MSEERFGIVVTAKMRHGDLWDAAKKMGGNAALARQLGMRPSHLGNWINLQNAPTHKWLETEKGIEVADKLLLLCAKTPSELWPQELRAAIAGGEVGRKLEKRHDVEMSQLALFTTSRLMLPSPDLVIAESDTMDVLHDLLRQLHSRERRIITLRFGVDGQDVHTLDETSKILGISRGRVLQIESRALRKLSKLGCTLKRDVREELETYVASHV